MAEARSRTPPGGGPRPPGPPPRGGERRPGRRGAGGGGRGHPRDRRTSGPPAGDGRRRRRGRGSGGSGPSRDGVPGGWCRSGLPEPGSGSATRPSRGSERGHSHPPSGGEGSPAATARYTFSTRPWAKASPRRAAAGASRATRKTPEVAASSRWRGWRSLRGRPRRRAAAWSRVPATDSRVGTAGTPAGLARARIPSPRQRISAGTESSRGRPPEASTSTEAPASTSREQRRHRRPSR